MSVLGKRPMPTREHPDKGAPFSSYPLVKPAGNTVSQPFKMQKVSASDGIARGVRVEPVFRGLDSSTPMLNGKAHWSPQADIHLQLPSGAKVVFKDDEGSADEWPADSRTVILVNVRRWTLSDVMTDRSLGLFSALFLKRTSVRDAELDNNNSSHELTGLSMLNYRLTETKEAEGEKVWTQSIVDFDGDERRISDAVVDHFREKYSLWGTLVKVDTRAKAENRGRPLTGTVVDGPTKVINYWMSDNPQNGDFVGFAFVRRPKEAKRANDYRDIVRELQRLNEISQTQQWALAIKAQPADLKFDAPVDTMVKIVHRKGALVGVQVEGSNKKTCWLRTVNRKNFPAIVTARVRNLDHNGYIRQLGEVIVEPDRLQREDATPENLKRDADALKPDAKDRTTVVGKPKRSQLYYRKRELLLKKNELDRNATPVSHEWLIEPWSCRSAAGPGDNFAAGLHWSGHIMRLGRIKSGVGQPRGGASHLSPFSGTAIFKSGAGGVDHTCQRAIFPRENTLDKFDQDIQHLKHIFVMMHLF